MPRVKKETLLEKKTVKKTSGLIIPVYDIDGQEKESLSLPKEIFQVKANSKLLAQYIRVYLTNQRQGTASTKTRTEVSGSTRKIYRQKGTGRARHGDIKAPIFVGGGIVHGPKPRDYSLKMNKKQKKQALFSALSLKLAEKSIIGLEESALKIEPKTKKIASLLNKIGLKAKKVVFILPKIERNNFVLAVRNIPKTIITDPISLNAYQVLKNDFLVFFDKAVKIFSQHFLKHED